MDGTVRLLLSRWQQQATIFDRNNTNFTLETTNFPILVQQKKYQLNLFRGVCYHLQDN